MQLGIGNDAIDVAFTRQLEQTIKIHNKVFRMRDANLCAIKQWLQILTPPCQRQKTTRKNLKITRSKVVPHLGEFSLGNRTISLGALARHQQQTADSAELTPGIVSNLEKGLLARIPFVGSQRLSLLGRHDIA